MSELMQIHGIGATLAKKLETAGVSLATMAQWTEDDIDRIDDELSLKGRARADDWKEQAIVLVSKKPAKEASPPADDEDEGTPAAPATATTPDDPAVALAKQLQAAGITFEMIANMFASSPPVAAPATPAVAQAKRRKLDPNQKYANVVGQHLGAAYEQDGRFFDQNRIEIVVDPKTGEIVPIGSGERAIEPPAPTSRNVHFLNYLDNKIELPFDVVREAVKRMWRRDCKTEKDLRQYLHDQLRGNNR